MYERDNGEHNPELRELGSDLLVLLKALHGDRTKEAADAND